MPRSAILHRVIDEDRTNDRDCQVCAGRSNPIRFTSATAEWVIRRRLIYPQAVALILINSYDHFPFSVPLFEIPDRFRNLA